MDFHNILSIPKKIRCSIFCEIYVKFVINLTYLKLGEFFHDIFFSRKIQFVYLYKRGAEKYLQTCNSNNRRSYMQSNMQQYQGPSSSIFSGI